MRFDDLFEDLAGTLAAEADRGLWDEAQGLARGERARQGWAERLGGEASWRLRLAGSHTVSGQVSSLGEDWLLLATQGVSCCVPFGALRTASPEPRQIAGTASGHSAAQRRKETFRATVRLLSRHRPEVVVLLETGESETGRLIQVGLDHVELRGDAGLVLLALDAISALTWREG